MFDVEELEAQESQQAGCSPRAARCARERERTAATWVPQGHDESFGAERRDKDQAPGMLYGLSFPSSGAELQRLGPAWLTRAMHAAGTLPEGNRVASIKELRWLSSRGATTRLLLEVEYKDSHNALHTKLAVKIPRLADEQASKLGAKASANKGFWRFRTVSDEAELPGPYPPLRPKDMFAEINFYRLYEADAPLRMPKFYYGDISSASGRFILITELAPLPLLDVQRCLLRGAHGRYLASFPVGSEEGRKPADKQERRQGVYMSPCPGAMETWTLRPADNEGCKVFLQTSNTEPKYLSTFNDKEQAFFLSPNQGPWEKWALVPLAGERELYFLKGAHGTYLASLDDERQSLYMSPKAETWERWRCISLEPGQGMISEHLDVRGAGIDLCERLVCAGAELAGMHKAGKLGTPEFLSGSFERVLVSPQQVWEPDATWHGLGDKEFIARAARAQEFIIQVGAVLFPEGVVTPATMKGYRAMLVTTRANVQYLRWWCSSNEDYVALGHDRLDMDSAFRWQENGARGDDQIGLGLRDWEGVSVGPLGSKLWGWLRFAESDVLVNHRDDLLRTFIAAYRRAGGPELDLEDLRTHFVLAAALESVQLLDVVPDIYRCWPKDEWVSIKNLRDPRLGSGSLWLCLKSLVNIALVLSTCDMVELLYQVMPLIFHRFVHTATPSKAYFTGAEGASVRAQPEPAAALVSHLSPHFCLLATGRQRLSEDGQAEWLEVKHPVHGWVEAPTLLPAYPEDDQDSGSAAASAILERMAHARRQYTGASPLGMSTISIFKLCDTLQKYDKMFKCLQQFGRGGCKVATGGFLVEEERKSWWPRGYEDWAQHTFLVFEDGTIADITADQFDDVPQVWLPADPQRYTFDPSKADRAESMRETVGIERWTELVKRDRTIPPARKRYAWWAQNQKEGDVGRGATGGRHTAPVAPRRGPSGSEAVVLRGGSPMQLPPVTRHVDLGEGRPAAAFRRISEEGELAVWLVEHIFRPHELQELVGICERRGGFEPSLQTTTLGQQVQDQLRTSYSCTVHWPFLWGGSLEELQRQKKLAQDVEEELVAAQRITDLCGRVLEVGSEYIEPLQLVKYRPGQFYRAHMDTHKEPDRLSSFNGEQRTHTLLVFMADVPESDGGGHLHFPRLGLKVLPRAGSAVLWSNVREGSGRPDPNSLHEGMPPLKSEKVALNVWQVDRPFTAESIVEGRLRKLRTAAEASAQPARTPDADASEPLLSRKLREEGSQGSQARSITTC